MQNLKQQVFQIRTKQEFNDTALEIFSFQYHNNPVYRNYCELMGKRPGLVDSVAAIPFLPIEFFRTHRIVSFEEEAVMVFHSSGTTSDTPSSHYIRSLDHYHQSILESFRLFFGEPSDYMIAALTPSATERPDSSLAQMNDFLIRCSGHPRSGFYLGREAELVEAARSKDSRPLFLIGLSFALLDMAEQQAGSVIPDILVETGGMKGRRMEISREALHEALCKGFSQKHIHSEYSMCELFSQAWSKGDGWFECPPWMKVLLRDPQDPPDVSPERSKGGINIIDLANIDTCSFIATQDLGELMTSGRFRVNGRFSNSVLKGCNLMLE
jgi:hypothetical protein